MIGRRFLIGFFLPVWDLLEVVSSLELRIQVIRVEASRDRADMALGPIRNGFEDVESSPCVLYEDRMTE